MTKARRGRPRNTAIQEFSVEGTPWTRHYLVRFKISGDAFVASVRRPGTKWPRGMVETYGPYKAFYKAVKEGGLSQYTLGKTFSGNSDICDVVARRLAKMFRDHFKTQT